MNPLLADIPFSNLANALMAGLGARSHEWRAWLLIEYFDGNVELLLLTREPFEREDKQLSTHWHQRKIHSTESPSTALIEMFEQAHLGQNARLSTKIPSWKELPSSPEKRDYAQGAAGAEAFTNGRAVKVRSSKGYLAYEAMDVST